MAYTPDTLQEFYSYVIVTQGATGVVGKICLGSVLLLVARGNVEPGYKLLVGVLGAQFAMAAYLSVGMGGSTLVVFLTALVMMLCCFYSLVAEKPQWRVVPEEDMWRYAAIAGYLVAFGYPFLSGLPVVRRVIFSPVSVVPHPMLLTVLVLTAVSGLKGSKSMGYAAIALALTLAVVDFLNDFRASGFVLFAYGIICGGFFLGKPLLESEQGIKGLFVRDEEEISSNVEKDSPEKSRKWNLR